MNGLLQSRMLSMVEMRLASSFSHDIDEQNEELWSRFRATSVRTIQKSDFKGSFDEGILERNI